MKGLSILTALFCMTFMVACGENRNYYRDGYGSGYGGYNYSPYSSDYGYNNYGNGLYKPGYHYYGYSLTTGVNQDEIIECDLNEDPNIVCPQGLTCQPELGEGDTGICLQ